MSKFLMLGFLSSNLLWREEAKAITPVVPNAVTNLAVTTQTTTSLSFSFTLPKDNESTNAFYSYRVRYSTQPITSANFADANLFASITNANSLNQSFTIPNLNPGSTYYVSLKVYSGLSNFSDLSNVATKSTTPPIPAPVADLKATAQTQTTLSFSFDLPAKPYADTALYSYRVRYSTAPITEANFASANLGPTITTASTLNQTFILSGLTSGTTYYVALKNYDSATNFSALSNIVPASTMVPVPPTVTTLTSTGASHNSLSYSFHLPANPTQSGKFYSYRVRYSTQPLTEANFANATLFSTVTTATSATQAFSIAGLSLNTTYYVALKIYDSSTNFSAMSDVATTATFPVTPAAVTDLKATAQTASTLSYSFTLPTNPAHPSTFYSYEIKYSLNAITDSNFAAATSFQTVLYPTSAAQKFTIPALASSSSYYVAVKVYDVPGNESLISNIPLATTLPPVPLAVTNLASSGITTTSLSFSFTIPAKPYADSSLYLTRIRYSTQPITDANFANAILIPTTTPTNQAQTFTLPALTAGTTYYVALKVYDSSTNFSPLSNIVSATVLPPLPAWTSPANIFCANTSALDKPGFYAGQTTFDILGRVPTLPELQAQAPIAIAAANNCASQPGPFHCTWKALATITMQMLNSAEGVSVNGATATDNTKFINLIYTKYLHQTVPAADLVTFNAWLTNKAMTQTDLMTDALLSTAYRQDFAWEGGKCGLPIIGTNGHPLNSTVYQSVGISQDNQFKMLTSLGLKEYRVNIQGPTTVELQAPKIQGLLNLANSYNVTLLPAIFVYPSSSVDNTVNYMNAFNYAQSLVSLFKGKIGTWELMNELDIKLLLSGKVGHADSDYDQAGMAMYAAAISGLADGVRAADPAAKTIVNFSGFTHTGFIAGMVSRGVNFDIVGLHWYANMGDMNCPTQQFPCPAKPVQPSTFTLLKAGAPGKTIRWTEGDYVAAEGLTAENQEIRQQNKLFTLLMTYLHQPRLYPIDRFDIYELLSEVQKADSSLIESNYGLYAMKDNGNGTYTLDHEKLAGQMLPLIFGNTTK